jgi:predicted regulator of Ras-like GTPase activity (Roadblock/LC7/MglB family)
MSDDSTTGIFSAVLQQELSQLNQRGGFTASVLTDGDGLPIAVDSHADGQLPEMLAAVAPLVERMVQRSNERVGLSEASEVVINNADGSHLVCRFFEARHRTLILACLVRGPNSYRRAMNMAVRAIQAAWRD